MFTLPVDELLPDGTYLSRLKAPRKLRKDGAADITVRVIEYRLEDEHGEVTETFTLITTLLDPAPAPPGNWQSCIRPGGRSGPRWAR